MKERRHYPLLVVLGPTASGKTKLSLTLAEQHEGEIISGDSMQVYRGMDIGTAKATPEERQAVPHHMIDILDPADSFSVADFQERARREIAEIASRGRLPILVGGTGLYIESLCYDYRFTDAGSDEAFREEQQRFADERGEQALHDRLRAVDPATADKLHPNDTRRVIRALEVAHLTGIPLSEHLAGQTKEPLYDLCLIGLTMDRALLYKRIEQRVDQMMEEGLVDEVRRLRDAGYPDHLVSMQGLGYKEIAAYLRGECTLEAAVALLKKSTRRFAKRQLSWFRHMSDIHWVDVTEQANFPEQLHTINAIIAGKL